MSALEVRDQVLQREPGLNCASSGTAGFKWNLVSPSFTTQWNAKGCIWHEAFRSNNKLHPWSRQSSQQQHRRSPERLSRAWSVEVHRKAQRPWRNMEAEAINSSHSERGLARPPSHGQSASSSWSSQNGGQQKHLTDRALKRRLKEIVAWAVAFFLEPT